MVGDETPVFNPGWRFKAAFAAIMIALLMAALEATSLPVALSTMAHDLNGTAIEAFWSGTAFLLASTVLQPFLGSLSTLFGRKPVLLFSITLFGIGSVVAGIAKNMTIVLVGRTIMGIGCGGILTLSEIVITDMVPLRERSKWLSFQGVVWSIGTIAGPLLGGGFAQSVSWRWVFYINLPFIGVGTPLIVFFLRLSTPISSLLTKLRRIDWFGTVLFVASTTGFLIPLSWGGIQYAWDSWRTLVPLILCGVGFVAFIVYEELLASEPLLLTTVFKNRTAAAAYLQNFLHGVLLWCILFYLPLYYQAVKGYGPIRGGISLFPLSFTVAPAAGFTGFAIAKTGKYRWAIWSGWILTTLGTGLLVKLELGTSTVAWVFLTMVGGFGFGNLFASMVIAVQAATAPENQAHAVTAFTFIRAFGQTVGVAIGGVTFQNSIRHKLLTYPELASLADVYSRDAAGLVRIIQTMPDGIMKTHLKESFAYGLRSVWIVLCVMSGVALISTLFIRPLILDQELKTDQGFQHGNSDQRSTTEMLIHKPGLTNPNNPTSPPPHTNTLSLE